MIKFCKMLRVFSITFFSIWAHRFLFGRLELRKKKCGFEEINKIKRGINTSTTCCCCCCCFCRDFVDPFDEERKERKCLKKKRKKKKKKKKNLVEHIPRLHFLLHSHQRSNYSFFSFIFIF